MRPTDSSTLVVKAIPSTPISQRSLVPKSKALLKDFETDFDNDGWHAYRDATNDEFDEILDRFADALESWAIEVHKDAPIAFFAGPDGASSDWHEWSVSQLADVAYPLIAAYEESGPDLDRIDRKVLGNDENKSNQEAAAFIMKHVGWCRSVVESHAA